MPTEPSKAALAAANEIMESPAIEAKDGALILAAIIDRALEPERKAADDLYSQMISHASPRIGGMVGQPEVDAWKAAIRAYRSARNA